MFKFPTVIILTGRGHEGTPTKGLKSVKKTRTSNAGRPQEAHDVYASSDGEQLSATSSSVQRRKKTVKRRRHDEHDDDPGNFRLY